MLNDYLILCKTPIVSFEYWFAIYEQIRKSKKALTFGYGIQVSTNHYPELEIIRKQLPFKDKFFFLISNRKHREFPIHVDGIPGNYNSASINWPIQNCDERSPTTWYTCNNIKFKNIDNSYFLDNIGDATEIYTQPMMSVHRLPYLFRSDILHKGYCNMNENGVRIIVKWELEINDWSTACTEFQNRNYI